MVTQGADGSADGPRNFFLTHPPPRFFQKFFKIQTAIPLQIKILKFFEKF